MNEKSRWQQEFDALPEWTQDMVRGLGGCGGYGGGSSDLLADFSSPNEFEVFHIILKKSNSSLWWVGFTHIADLAKALSAPWPPPPPPERKKRVFNLVELAASVEGEDDCAFDQPCAYGHRVESHAVYCHNDAWPDSPGKCRRNRTDYLHEDCPGFVANPDEERCRQR